MNTRIFPTARRVSLAVVPFALCLILVLFEALPFSIPKFGSVTPLFSLMAVFYWCIYRHNFMPPYAIFLIGVLRDALGGGPFGLTALLLLLVHAFIVHQRRVFHGKSFMIEWFGFSIVAIGFSTIAWLTASIYYLTPMQPAPVVGQVGLSIALYPCIAWTISQVHRRLVRREAL